MDFNKLFGRKQKSGEVAKSRLQLVLMQDRTNISPSVLEALKTDIIEVISRYIEIDESDLDVKIERDGNTAPVLIANIPVKDLRGKVRQ